MNKTTMRALALATAAVAALSVPAGAQEERVIKLTHVFPSTHWLATDAIQPFIDHVTEATGGKIKFEVYHAGQLGKEVTQLVTSGLAEMGLTNPSYEIEKLPLTGVLELPGFHSTSCEGTRQYWEMAKEGGPLYEAEYKPAGLRPLVVVTLNPYEVQTKAKVVESMEDMQGLKLRANGAMGKAVAALGGVPVQVSSTEFFDAVSRGTIDGGMWLTGSTRTGGMEGQLMHTVKGVPMGAGAPNIIVSEKIFQSLDAETQKIFVEAGMKVNEHICAFLDARHEAEEKILVESGNLTLHQLSPDEVARWNEKITPVADEWAAEMESTGRPGKQMLESYRSIAASIE